MDLSIVYFNDVHGYMQAHPELFFEGEGEVVKRVGGYSRIKSFIQTVAAQSPHTLVFDGGDTFHGTLPVVESKGEVLVPILKQLGISAMVGHWDFAYGPDHLLHLASQLNYPVLGCNVYKEDGSLFLPPYSILEVGGRTIAVVGICCQIVDKTMPPHFSKGLRFTTGAEELPRYIQEVKSRGADLVILLSHNGFAQDFDLLSKVEGVDLCLSAHTHNRLYEPAKVGQTLIIQCGCHGVFAGHLQLELGAEGVKGWRYQLVAMDEKIPQDPEMEVDIERILQPYRHLEQERIGATRGLLHRYNELSSSMDDLLLAAMAHATGCKVAFSNGWRYGIPIPAGPITRSDLYNIIPMNPPLSTIELSGAEIQDMLEENLERTFSADPMHQMGGYAKRCLGIRAYIKIENPKGYRIQQLFVEGLPVEKQKLYKVCFVTEQGVPKGIGQNRKESTVRAVEAMEAFLKHFPTFERMENNSFVPV